MNLDSKVEQLTLLVSDMIPLVDTLVLSQKETDVKFKETDVKFKETDVKINKLLNAQAKTNLSIGELRQSNLILAETIERLITKIDKID